MTGPPRTSDLPLALPLDLGPDLLALPRRLAIDLGFDRIAGSENGAPNLSCRHAGQHTKPQGQTFGPTL